MCIQFVYVNNDASENEWQLVIANNRDELYTRPTKPATQSESNCIISGIDLEPGREGGTWIGINTSNGKFGTLLNILTNQQQTKTDKLGRGNLVTDFLQNSGNAYHYLSTIIPHAEHYNPFNLCLMEYRNRRWHTTYYTNGDDKLPEEIESLKFGLGNSVINKPWQKLLYGQEVFNDAVDKYNRTDELQSLTKELMTLMNDSSSHLPDAQLQSQAEGYLDKELTTQRSGIYVDSRQIKYGTRTNTFILIDGAGKGKYIERTMREPVDPDDPVWDINTIDFFMNNSQDSTGTADDNIAVVEK